MVFKGEEWKTGVAVRASSGDREGAGSNPVGSALLSTTFFFSFSTFFLLLLLAVGNKTIIGTHSSVEYQIYSTLGGEYFPRPSAS